jgi:hypothetical protein
MRWAHNQGGMFTGATLREAEQRLSNVTSSSPVSIEGGSSAVVFGNLPVRHPLLEALFPVLPATHFFIIIVRTRVPQNYGAKIADLNLNTILCTVLLFAQFFSGIWSV